MKKCPYCGSQLHDEDRYCLYCMKLLSQPRSLSRYEKRIFPYRLAVVTLVLLLAMAGMFGGFCLYHRPISTTLSPVVSENSLGGESSSHTESDHSQPEESSKTEMSSKKEEPTKETSDFSQAQDNDLSQTSDFSSEKETSEQGEDSLMTADEFFEKMALLEEKELKTKLPGAVRTKEDLGIYAKAEVLEGEYEAVSSQSFDSVYKAEPDYRMDLVNSTLNVFQYLDAGFGDSGKYNWKLLEAKIITNDIGTKSYFIRVEVQTQVDDPAVTESGVNTLEVVRQVRSHLLQSGGQRVNALPQQFEGHIFVETLDPKGEIADSVKTQREMIESICEEIDFQLDGYGYSSYVFDFRLRQVESHSSWGGNPDCARFTFSYYLKPV